LALIYKCGFTLERHFTLKNLKRATQFQISLSSPLFVSTVLALSFTFFSSLHFHHFKFRLFIHSSFSFLTSLALTFSFLTSLAHLHFRLLFRTTATASAAAFVACLCHSDHQQPWFTERLVLYLKFFEFLFNILNLYFFYYNLYIII